ncbi:MAG: type I restriction endonuclease subunit R [Methanosphaera stadtmanae]|nr:type I restriction endonuclease subunit R [Methanosphaera stadtmanae]
MSSDTTERGYQQDIVDYLRSTGYVDRTIYNSEGKVELYSKKSHYNKNLCLDAELTLNFIKVTQPTAWKKFERIYKEDANAKFIDSLKRELDKKGTINVLKKGFRDAGAKFKLYYPKPNSNINEELMDKFSKNVLSVIQEVAYQNVEKGNRVDLVTFVNGLPITTIELKDSFSQGVENAIKQYENDRDPEETLFKRCLVHFAMSDEKIYMTTKLNGVNTKFLPFNRGLDNPDIPGFYRTSYLYTDILQPNQLSNLISNFIFYEKDDKKKEKKLIFPRYHQLDCVNMLVDDAHPGANYLIEHSAGSGKTKTIAWLAHRLKNLFDENGERVYDLIIIISDRRVIDKQLQDQVLAIEKTKGSVTVIDEKKNSRDLAEAMHTSKNIVVSTIHKFSYIKDLVKDLPDRNYAIIVDEAHSSQTGKHAQDVKIVTGSDKYSEEYDEDEFDDEDDKLLEEMEKIRNNSNLSYFAFTATPKKKTLELFGKKYDDGSFHAHHLYSMKQAIEEGFILDVLKNYITYPTYWKLAKKVEEDPEFDKDKAMKVLVGFVEEHPKAIEDKVKIILEHFNNSTKYKINGKARAMIVTRSRKAAVLYKLELDRQINSNNKYSDIKPLVAFTGTVKHDTVEYTENNMNNIKGDIKEALKNDPNKILVVADKFQTGFDEPLLHTMYVDKKLRDVKAVQTLSRVNRIHPDKNDTLILDFVNEKEEIQRAFQPFYEETYLEEETDYRKLYDIMGLIIDEEIYTEEDTEEFYEKYSSNAPQNELQDIINKAVDNYKVLSDEQQDHFKKSIRRFQNLYGFLCQLLPFSDTSLAKMYIYNKYLYKKLPTINNPLPYSVLEDVNMETYKIDTSDEGSDITLIPSGKLTQSGSTAGTYKPGEEKKLSEILEDLNERYGSIFKKENTIILKQIVDEICENEDIKEMLQNKNNSEENFEAIFDEILKEVLFKIYKTNRDFYQTINSNLEAKNDLRSYLIKFIRENSEDYI